MVVLSASAAVALGTLLTASVLHAQSAPPSPLPAQNPIEVVYSTNSSKRPMLKLDFATGRSTVVNAVGQNDVMVTTRHAGPHRVVREVVDSSALGRRDPSGF